MLIASLAVVIPGAAQARVDSDPCNGTDIGQSPSGLICGTLEQLQGGDDGIYGGADYTEYPDDNALPSTALVQCPPGTRIPGTDYWSGAFSYNWSWDYYVEWGSWVLWDGGLWGTFPRDGIIGNDAGFNSIAVSLNNWHYGSSDWLDVRVFWKCEPVGGSGSRPEQSAGTGGHDSLHGEAHDNALIGLGGNDHLRGHRGDDHLHGGEGNDRLEGGAHDDLMHGRRGSDTAIGGNGDDDILPGKSSDVARGGEGSDQLFDDEGSDELRGGAGNDRFSARDGDRDVIRCGAGEDIAIIDGRDLAIECEHAYRSDGETPLQLPRI